jgi:hypothetical protein
MGSTVSRTTISNSLSCCWSRSRRAAQGATGRARSTTGPTPRCPPEQQAAPDAVLILDGIFLYVEGQRRYLREAQPWERATVIVDNTDLAEPVIIEPTLVSADSNL